MSERDKQNYYTLDFEFGDEISFTQATLDARYRGTGLQDLILEKGPYLHYRVVDFPDNDRFSPWSCIGVRKDGFHGQMPLYYVRCMDVIDRELRPIGTTIMKNDKAGFVLPLEREHYERGLEHIIPTTTYRIYIGGEHPTIVALEEGQPLPYPEKQFVGKAFFEKELAELALYGYRLLQGDWLSIEERFHLAKRLMQ